jgi:hypothetical protein
MCLRRLHRGQFVWPQGALHHARRYSAGPPIAVARRLCSYRRRPGSRASATDVTRGDGTRDKGILTRIAFWLLVCGQAGSSPGAGRATLSAGACHGGCATGGGCWTSPACGLAAAKLEWGAGLHGSPWAGRHATPCLPNPDGQPGDDRVVRRVPGAARPVTVIATRQPNTALGPCDPAGIDRDAACGMAGGCEAHCELKGSKAVPTSRRRAKRRKFVIEGEFIL